jgi:hypothetical protein
LVRGAGRRQVLRRRRASRHALDCFHRRRHRLGIRFGPTKISRKPLEKLVDLFALDPAFDKRVVPFVRLWIGRIWMVCGHGNLIADIVGEFTPWRMLNLTRPSESVERPLQRARP